MPDTQNTFLPVQAIPSVELTNVALVIRSLRAFLLTHEDLCECTACRAVSAAERECDALRPLLLSSRREQRPPGYPADATCRDCGVPEGNLHDYFPNCTGERCPFCFGQLITCPHGNRKTAVQKRGRIPFTFFPNLCSRCGIQWPEMFMVADWEKVIPRDHWEEMLCFPCYSTIKSLQPVGEHAEGVLDG